MAGGENLSDKSLFIQFAGQGVKYMDDLRRIYQSTPDIRPFIHQAADTLNAQAALYDDSQTGFFSKGLDVAAWINTPGSTPDLGYLLSSPLSHPLIYLTQISSYMSFLLEGVNQDRLLERTHSVTGFSTGIVAAILVSMGLPYDSLCQWALKVMAMFVWQGIRCQEAMMTLGVNPELIPDRINSVEGSPSCMASITNLTRGKLDSAIAACNALTRIHPAYELFPGRWIISGLPQDLERFKIHLNRHESQAEWRYIPSTIGAHSPLLAYAYETSPKDAERLGLSFSKEDMVLPVLSNDKGTDIRENGDILNSVMRAYFLHPAHWRKQITPVLPKTTLRYVLDFGPGTGVASLTENHCARSGVQVVRCAILLGRKKFLDELMPDLR